MRTTNKKQRLELTRYCPFAFLYHGLDSLDNARVGLSNIFGLKDLMSATDNLQQTKAYRQLVERTSFLNISKGLLQRRKLSINLVLSLLSVLHLIVQV